MKTYEKEMKQCIKLALKGQGKVSPNPLVGCVVLDSQDNIISTGYHAKYGEYHAERTALNKLKDAKGCTLVVNLEPCCHTGKTPPCTDIIIEKKIKKVIYGMKDPNHKVCGKGLEILKNSGIEIVGPVLEDKCKQLNEIFIKNQKKEVFIAIKTATTIDGKISTHNGDSKWITSEKARKEVKKIRKKYDAILTSSKTVLADNPTMKHKKKIILDRELKISPDSNICKDGEIFIFHDKKLTPQIEKENITYIPTPVINKKLDLKYINKKIFELGIMSILVEAGGEINASFLPFADKIYHFTAPKILADNSGKSCFSGSTKDKISQCHELELTEVKKYLPDILLIYSKKRNG